MSLQVDKYLKDLEEKLKDVIPDDVFSIYDSETLMDWEAKLDPPCAGAVYGGMTPDGNDKRGIGQYLEFYVYVLAGSNTRLKTKNIKESEICETIVSTTAFLDTMRTHMRGQCAFSGKPWIFTGESPFDFGKRGIGYIMQYKVSVTI